MAHILVSGSIGMGCECTWIHTSFLNTGKATFYEVKWWQLQCDGDIYCLNSHASEKSVKQSLKANLLHLYLQSSVTTKSYFPETHPSKMERSLGIQASTRWLPGVSIFAFCKASIKPCPFSHWTHKHSFSLTELTAMMNLNSEMHKRRLCFNSCFYTAALELLLPRQLVLISLCFLISPVVSMPSCQGTPLKCSKTKAQKRNGAREWDLLDAKASYTGAPHVLT